MIAQCNLSQQVTRSRRGFLTPAIAVALVVVMGCLALVLDRLWLDAAVVELTTAAEAAALAAARELASDHRLQNDAAVEDSLDAARRAAVNVAAKNLAAGGPIALDARPNGDIRFGRRVISSATGESVFLETNSDPTTVVVIASRLRRNKNPVALFLKDLTRKPNTEAATIAEASIDPHVIGLRPIQGLPLPVLPIAILNCDRSASRTDTWQVQIEKRAGGDRYGLEPGTGQVVAVPDGIPEIVLHACPVEDAEMQRNSQLVDLGNGLRAREVLRQIDEGVSADDLAGFGGELIPTRTGVLLRTDCRVESSIVRSLHRHMGEPRIWPLYESGTVDPETGRGHAKWVGLIAGRIMSIRELRYREYDLVVQPTVMTTRYAVTVSAEEYARNRVACQNHYIYRLQLTN